MGNNYNPGWSKHPNLRWDQTGNQTQAAPQPRKPSPLEELLNKFANLSKTNFENIQTTVANQGATIKSLETQIGQLSKLVNDDRYFYGIFSIIISSKMTKTDPNTKGNLQKQEKASRQSPRCKKTRKNPKSEEIEHSIAARCVPWCHDGSCLVAKKSEEINLEKIFHRSTICHNAAQWSNLAPKLMNCTGSVIKLN
ncbi:hypothetical protein QL285_032362 [Trifolium repens]|nr:hypothetical protein QL285_032362 [Trifolium repens]